MFQWKISMKKYIAFARISFTHGEHWEEERFSSLGFEVPLFIIEQADGKYMEKGRGLTETLKTNY